MMRWMFAMLASRIGIDARKTSCSRPKMAIAKPVVVSVTACSPDPAGPVLVEAPRYTFHDDFLNVKIRADLLGSSNTSLSL